MAIPVKPVYSNEPCEDSVVTAAKIKAASEIVRTCSRYIGEDGNPLTAEVRISASEYLIKQFLESLEPSTDVPIPILPPYEG